MAREDIIAGLKNAVERGYSLEKAKLSFISAGYIKEDVEEAARAINPSSDPRQAEKDELTPFPSQAITRAVLPSGSSGATSIPQRKGNGSGKFKIIILVIILVLLLSLLGITFFFKDQIIPWVENVFG